VKLKVNGQEAEIPEGASLADYLSGQGFNLEAVVVELNGGILKKDDWPRVRLQSRDRLEVVSFVGGG